MKCALITGVTGQDGSYLAEFLLEKNYKVVGLVSEEYDIGDQNIKHFKDKLILEKGDLLDKDSLITLFKKHKPDEVYNLAGLTFVPVAWENPTLALNINALGFSRILELVRDSHPKTRVYQACSAKIFGDPKVYPQNEDTKIVPLDPYGISKAISYFLAKSMRDKYGLFIASAILFNHESPRRGLEFVTRKITFNAAKIKLGLADKLALGDLNAKQDWGYAPDYVKAMWLMLQQDEPDDYVIATGKLHSVKDICEIAFSSLGLNWEDYVIVDEKFVRKGLKTPIVGDNSKAKEVLGWEPEMSFEEMIKLMVKSDLEKLNQEEIK